MKAHKPKISFDPTPAKSPVEQPFDREAWEKQLTPPPAPPPRRIAVEPIPKAPGFAATGLMAEPEAAFLQRNARSLAMTAVVALTFLLGLATAVLWLDGEDAAPAVTAQLPAVPQPQMDQLWREDATRAASPDLTDVSASAVPEDAVTPPLAALSATVLAGLAPKPVAPEVTQAQKIRNAAEALSANKLRMLREGVLAGNYTVQGYVSDGQQRVRLGFLNTDLTDQVSTDFLYEDLSKTQPELAKALNEAGGGLDTDTMMFSLVQAGLMAEQTLEGAAAAREMSRKIFVASPARSENIAGQRVYTVQSGDSLAYIALQFYGLPQAYTRIIEANRDTLQSPDTIQVGQRLIIPS